MMDCELAANRLSPLWTARMVYRPATEKRRVKRALPPGPGGAVPRTTLPSKKVKVPVGVPAPGARAATVAVKTTDCPVTTEDGEALRVVVVADGLTVSVTARGAAGRSKATGALNALST